MKQQALVSQDNKKGLKDDPCRPCRKSIFMDKQGYFFPPFFLGDALAFAPFFLTLASVDVVFFFPKIAS
jgi:hypothetical protein